jgi:signal transduction histidine kinase
VSGSQVGEPVSAADSQELFERWRRDRDREARDELIAQVSRLLRRSLQRLRQLTGETKP